MAPRPTRRQLLFGTAGTLGAAGLFGAGGALLSRGEGDEGSEDETTSTVPQRVPTPSRGTSASRDAVVTIEWIHSPARGRKVRLVTVLPAGASRGRLPVCVGLHGLRGTALWWSDQGTRHLLASAWSSGVSPYAVVAVDGGDNYWHSFNPADDPMRMLLTELPQWLRARGLGGPEGLPAVAAGVSMGGTGALLYARERHRLGRPLLAAAALSPGLFLDWRFASRRPFRNPADWAAHDPMLFHRELASTPIGVWCGDRDPFVNAIRRYIATARPEVGRVTPGRHDGAYYASVLPDILAFLGRHLRTAAPPAGLPPVRPQFRPVG